MKITTLFFIYFLLINFYFVVLSNVVRHNILRETSEEAPRPNVTMESRRPFYVIGHMVNSLDEVDDFIEMGANALEVDIEFANNGTVLGTFHGAPCDCFRGCFKRETIADYLEYIRDGTSFADSRYKGKVILLIMDLKTSKLRSSAKKKAGLTLAAKLWKHLWEGVQPQYMVNVLLSIGYVKDKNVLKGVLKYFKKEQTRHILDKIGFDVGMNDPLEKIGRMYKQLGINGHRWQGDGLSNCVRFLVPVARLRQAVKARDNRKGYMDKVYHWTVDLPHFIRKSVEHGVDGIITNRPDNVLQVLNSTPYSELLKVADFNDSPWTRFIEPMLRNETERDMEVLGGGEVEERLSHPSNLDPYEITAVWTE
ncbi:dermonecrotic toxin LspaSicTox-alphaIA1i [Rhipicephalus microplus]|uniref:dermonecrotic toxin LspaSicTox-alphaIA1i n=1 Tax=Rhipicephalus microplus TaxID=6941 RepID=UPI003F6D605B